MLERAGADTGLPQKNSFPRQPLLPISLHSDVDCSSSLPRRHVLRPTCLSTLPPKLLNLVPPRCQSHLRNLQRTADGGAGRVGLWTCVLFGGECRLEGLLVKGKGAFRSRGCKPNCQANRCWSSALRALLCDSSDMIRGPLAAFDRIGGSATSDALGSCQTEGESCDGAYERVQIRAGRMGRLTTTTRLLSS